MTVLQRVSSQLLTFILFVLCLFGTSAWAQDPTNAYNVGFPENGVFSGSDFDSVQLNNGNLHIELPLFTVKGRNGLSVVSKYIYDSSGLFVIDEYCNHNGVCGWYVEPSGTAGWRFAGTANYEAGETLQTVECGETGTVAAYSFKLVDSNGTTHGMLPNPEGDCYDWAPLGSTLYASDGSGWSMITSGSAPYAISQNGTVIDSNTSVLVQDTNGNQITYNSESGVLTDTLGRTSSTPLISYVDSSGTTRTIEITPSTAQSGGIQTHLCGDLQNCGEYTTPGGPLYTTITLPGNELSYTINNSSSPSYGQPISISLPSGGQLSYTWANSGQSPIASRTETSGGQSYAWNYGSCTGSSPTVTDPSGNQQVATCMFIPTPGESWVTPVSYVTQIQYYQGSVTSGTLLKTVTTNYEQVGGIGGGCENVFKVTGGYLPNSETTTWNQINLVTQTQTDYDSVSSYCGSMLVNNPIEKLEYAYGSGSPGSLVRQTNYTYLHNSNPTYLTLNMLDRVTSKVIYDGSGNTKAQTTYAYDTTAITSTSGTPAPNHDYTDFPSTYTTRGNLTQTGQGLLVGSSWTWLNTTNTFDDLGNKLSTTDPNTNVTNFSYADNWGTDTNCTLGTNTFAYLTKTTDALSHNTTHSYFRCTGLTSNTKDQNDINNAGTGTSLTYDFLNRPLIVSYPDGGQTTSSYVDVAPLSVTQDKLVTSGLNIQRTSVFDGLGRLEEGQLNDPDCTVGSKLVKVDHTYGFTSGSGEYTQVSTPYCDTPNTTYGLMATTQKDAIGRVTSVTQTDGSTVTTTYSGTTAGLTSTVTDEAGKKRTSQTDALGRMTAVWEDPSGLDYLTSYTYDTLDNLLSVTQSSSRNRSFTYDTLSRLTCAANPEVTSSVNTPASCPASNSGTYTAGTIGYTYDSDGNMVTKTAPAPNQTSTSSTAVTMYSYDALNRLKQKSYTGGATTPSVKYGYDGSALTGCATTPPTLADSNPIGSRTAMCDGSGATSWSHDSMNRILGENRTINGSSAITRSFSYGYYEDGELNTLAYPSSSTGILPPVKVARTITYTANGSGGFSAGRPASAADTTDNFSYITSATYAPQGALASLTDGASILGAFSYNSRLQPLQMFYGTNTPPSLTGSTCPATVGNILHTVYAFNVGAGDNGNVISIANCQNTNLTKNFTYDSLNRIETAATQGTTCTDCWGQMFGHMSGSTFVPGIDAWGNLFQITATQGSPTTLSQSMTGNNQFTGMTYDASGNLINDGIGDTYTFDDENRLTGTAGYTYVYDGDGKRVIKCGGTYPTCSTGTLYWTGTGSDTISESALTGTIAEEYIFFNGKRVARRDTESSDVHYYFADHLGSADVITDNLGNIQKQSDYYPFGGEVVITGSDINNYKFTGKERDSESGLDNFGFRYYGSPLGRFMSADDGTDQVADNPQSWNLYSYVRNNPLRYTDPDGHDCIYFSSGGNPSVKSGDCVSDTDNGIYVNGTVNSLNYNANNSSWGFSYTAYDTGNIGAGTIANAPVPGPEPQMDNGAITPGFLGPGDLILFSGVKLPSVVTDAVGKLVGSILGKGAQQGAEQTVELTTHAATRLGQRGITQAAVDQAVQTAKAAGQVTTQMGKYGTEQLVYKGTNGITVVVETQGSNAGKAITVFQTGSKP